MFGQMRNRRSGEPVKPCPCNNTCRCHIPTESNLTGLIFGFVIVIFGAFIAISILFVAGPTKQYIEVNGVMCEVVFKETGITSTGAPVGHNVAFCPN